MIYNYKEIYNKISDKLLDGYNQYGIEYGNLFYNKLIKTKDYESNFSPFIRLNNNITQFYNDSYLEPLTIFNIINKNKGSYDASLINNRVRTFCDILNIHIENEFNIEYDHSYENVYYDMNINLYKKNDTSLKLIWELFKDIKNNKDIDNLLNLDQNIYKNSYRNISSFAYLINSNYLPITKYINPMFEKNLNNLENSFNTKISDENLINKYNKIKNYCIDNHFNLSDLIYKKNLIEFKSNNIYLTKEDKKNLIINNKEKLFFDFINKECNVNFKEIKDNIVDRKNIKTLSEDSFFADLINNEIENNKLIKVSKKWIVIEISDEYGIDGLNINNIVMIPNKKNIEDIDTEIDIKIYNNIEEFIKNESKLLDRENYEIKFIEKQIEKNIEFNSLDLL